MICTESQLKVDGEEIEEDSHLASFVLKELHQPEEQVAKKRGFDSNTMGLRFPIWLAACNHTKFTYTLTSPGNRERETDFVKLQSLASKTSSARSRHEPLKFLVHHIVKYLQNFHSTALPVTAYMCTTFALHVYNTHNILFDVGVGNVRKAVITRSVQHSFSKNPIL